MYDLIPNFIQILKQKVVTSERIEKQPGDCELLKIELIQIVIDGIVFVVAASRCFVKYWFDIWANSFKKRMRGEEREKKRRVKRNAPSTLWWNWTHTQWRMLHTHNLHNYCRVKRSLFNFSRFDVLHFTLLLLLCCYCWTVVLTKCTRKHFSWFVCVCFYSSSQLFNANIRIQVSRSI